MNFGKLTRKVIISKVVTAGDETTKLVIVPIYKAAILPTDKICSTLEQRSPGVSRFLLFLEFTSIICRLCVGAYGFKFHFICPSDV